MNSRQRLAKRLGSYWQMEAVSAILIPGVMLLLSSGKLSLASYFAMVPMVIMLIIGAAYWRSKYRQLTLTKHDVRTLLKRIAAWKLPALALSLLACVLAGMLWLFPQHSAGLADRVVASVAALLALLEYVNYYHRQLQHFDNMADFKRLLAGKGVRRSQMAADLATLHDR